MSHSARFDDSGYTRFRRLRNVFWFFSVLVKDGPIIFEASKSKEIAKTHGLDVATVKRIKARFRNELSFPGGDK